MTHEATFEVCGWWATTIGGFQGEAFCSRPHGHDDDHHDAHGEPIDLPANAERIGHMCAAYDEDDSGTLCARQPNHTGPCANRSGYVFDDAETVAVLHTCERPVDTMVIIRESPRGTAGTFHTCEAHSAEAVTTARAARMRTTSVHESGSTPCGTLRVPNTDTGSKIRDAFEADPFACEMYGCPLAQGHEGPCERFDVPVRVARPCPEPRCALLYGHAGFHMNLDAREWPDAGQLRALRTVAADWHDGQGSQLYAFASSGRVDDVADVLHEIAACDRHAGVSQTRRLRFLASYFALLGTEDAA